MIEPAPSPPHKRRSWWRGLGLAGLLLLAALAAAFVFRQEIASRAAVAYLDGQGIAVRALTVTQLTPMRLELRDLELGTAGEIAVARIEAIPSRDGLGIALREVTVEGLRVRIDVTGDAPPLGSLQPLLDRLIAGGSDAVDDGDGIDRAPAAAPPPATALPSVRFNDAQVILATPSGPMTAALSGGLEPAPNGDLAAEAALALDSDLGRLRATLLGRRAAGGDLALDVAVEEGRLAWQDFQVGAFTGDLSLMLPAGKAPLLNAEFGLNDLVYAPEGSPELRLTTGRLEAKGQPAEAAISLSLEGAEETLTLSGSAQQKPAAEAFLTTLNLQGEVRSAGGLTQFLPLPDPKIARGTLVFQAAGEGNLLDDATAAATWRSLPRLAPGKRLRLRGDAILAEVAFADGSQGISAHLPLELTLDGRQAAFALREDAEVRVEKPSRARLQALGLPDDVLALVASGLSLTLKAGGESPFRLVTTAAWPPREAGLRLSARAASDQGLQLTATIEAEARLGEDLGLVAFSGRVDAEAEATRFVFQGREARGIRLALPLSTSYGAEGLSLALTRAGKLGIRQFGRAAPLRLQDPLDFTVSALSLDPIPVEAGALEVRLTGRFEQAGGHDADLEIRLAGLSLPDHAVDAETAEVDIALDRELRPATSRFSLGPVLLGGDAALAAPLRVAGELARKGDGYDIGAILALAGGQALADVTARYADDGSTSVEVVSKLLIFAPDGLQPAAISPLLAGLEKVRGTLTATAGFAWPPDPAAEHGRVTLTNLSFDSPAGAVEGLDLDLTLTGLLPLASAPAQRLTVRGLDAAVPVEAIELTFALDQAPRPRLSIADGGFDLGGARWHIEPAILDPAATRQRIVLGTEALDLATFLRLLEVDGLSGSGTLDGSLPIDFEDGDVIVEDGRFEAQGPGRLSIRFEALRAALAGGGETVALAVQVLEDFHYENLTITLAKTAANDATVRLSTLGRNPAVMEGQPFQFNINLESNLTSVLEALEQGYSLSDDALRRAWRLRP